MTEPSSLTIYAVDSSSLMDWQARNYPVDVFPGLKGRIEALVVDGRFQVPALVQEEIEVVGTPGLVQWIKGQGDMIVSTADVLAAAVTIQSQFPGLIDPRATYEEADAYVIALARLRDGIVVTQETAAAEKRNPKRTHFIPDVCRDLGIPCINLLGLMRREGWSF